MDEATTTAPRTLLGLPLREVLLVLTVVLFIAAGIGVFAANQLDRADTASVTRTLDDKEQTR